MSTIVPPPPDAQGDAAHRPECGCLPPYGDCPHPPCDCWVCTEDGPDALDSPPIAALLHARLASWFGDERQAFLVADLVPVVTQIVSEFQYNAVEMARKAAIAEARAEGAESAIERARDVLDGWEHDGPDDPAIHLLIRRVREALDCLCDEACEHHWLDRPESDTRECLICGTEASG